MIALFLYLFIIMNSIVSCVRSKPIFWSGGTSTELCIYPEKSCYEDLDFLFRISVATIDSEVSTFTPLNRICRKFMILNGEVKLIHEGHHQKMVKPFDFDSFRGEWETKSIGKGRVLNVMHPSNVDVHFNVVKSERGQEYDSKSKNDFEFAFVASGSTQIAEDMIKTEELIGFRNKGEINTFKLGVRTTVVFISIQVN